VGRFKSPTQAHRFLAAHDQINTILKIHLYRLAAPYYRHARAELSASGFIMPSE